jgi:expansin (peptidoglycan-binding protein)
MRIVPLASALEGAGVVAYSQGTATSQVIGRSLAASDSAYLFHVPISSTRTTVQHRGGAVVLFNTANDQSVTLLNPAIDLAAGTVTARIAGSGGKPVTVFTITNAMALKPKTTTEDGVSKTTYQGARLALAPGVADVLASGLGLPTGSLPDGARFGTADVTVYAS